MRIARKIGLLISILILALMFGQVAEAKGLANRILITGPTLAEPLEVTDPDVDRLLSLAMLENFSGASPVVADGELPPGVTGDWYELERQYRADNGRYVSFDRVRFYPGEEGHTSYVYYVGIINGSSTYDGHWFQATPQGALAMKWVLNGIGNDYLALLRENGKIDFMDPATLEIATSIQLPGMPASISNFHTSIDGREAYYTSSSDGNDEQHLVNFETGVDCRVAPRSELLAFMPDGSGMVAGHYPDLQILDSASLAPISVFNNVSYQAHTLYFSSPDGVYVFVYSYDGPQATITVYNMITESFIGQAYFDDLEGDTISAAWNSDYPGMVFSTGRELLRLDISMGAVNVSRYSLGDDAVGTVLPVVTGSMNGQVFVVYPQGRTLPNDALADTSTGFPDGILVYNDYAQKRLMHWLPDVPLLQVTAADQQVYALSAPSGEDTTTLYTLDPETGNILNSISVPADTTGMVFAHLWLPADGLPTIGGCDQGPAH